MDYDMYSQSDCIPLIMWVCSVHESKGRARLHYSGVPGSDPMTLLRWQTRVGQNANPQPQNMTMTCDNPFLSLACVGSDMKLT